MSEILSYTFLWNQEIFWPHTICKSSKIVLYLIFSLHLIYSKEHDIAATVNCKYITDKMHMKFIAMNFNLSNKFSCISALPCSLQNIQLQMPYTQNGYFNRLLRIMRTLRVGTHARTLSEAAYCKTRNSGNPRFTGLSEAKSA